MASCPAGFCTFPPGPPKLPAPGPAWPWPTASGPPPLSGRPDAGVSGPPFPLLIDRLRTAHTPRSFKGRHLDLHPVANGQAARHRHSPLPSLSNKRRCVRTTGPAEATLPASVTNRVGTYNHQLGAPDRAFGGNHRELCQRSAHPPQVRDTGTGCRSNVSTVSTAPDQSVRIPARGRPSVRFRQRERGGRLGGAQARDLVALSGTSPGSHPRRYRLLASLDD